MLVLSRQVGESVIIEDVTLTLTRVGDGYVEVSLTKVSGGEKTVLTLPHDERVSICYDVEVIFVAAMGTKVRFGFEFPPKVTIIRHRAQSIPDE